MAAGFGLTPNKEVNMPVASILIPAYNRQKYIRETIECALAQTVEDIEVVLVDNCSTDDTFHIATQMASSDSRLKVFRNDQNLGAVRNWQKCAGHATAHFSKILFSDDLIRPDFLEKTLPPMFDRRCALSYVPGMVGTTPWEGGIHYKAFNGSTQIRRDYFIRAGTYTEHFMCHSPAAALFRTKDLRNNIRHELPGITGYDFNRYGAGVDWLIYMLTTLAYEHVAYVDEVLVFFRAHDESISIKNEDNLVPQGYVLAKQWLRALCKF
jgi:glycosyltransferase involved in cell wall biosynthesis